MSRGSWDAIRSKLRTSVQERGVLRTAGAGTVLFFKRRWWALGDLRFDLAHGVRTRGQVTHDHRGGDPAYAHARRYQGIGAAALEESLATLGIDETEYAFVDIGSGKGKALVLAAAHPFREIVGVELAPELNAVAIDNIERLRRRNADLPPIEIVGADATSYAFPDLPLVVFLYNPFDEVLMEQVIANLGSSLEQSGQPAFVIYTTPNHREVTDAAPFLRLHRELPHSVIYSSRPPAGG